MKINYFNTLLVVLLIFTSCQKDKVVTKPVEFTETTYANLGTWDELGRPNYLLTKDPISSELISFVKTMLPDKDLRTTHPELLQSTAIADIRITQQSDVYITYVSQGSISFGNTLGFYTYPTNAPPSAAKDIQTITYIFPQAGVRTYLEAGDKVKIGRFDPGTSIGFVLLQGAWDFSKKTLNNKVPHYCSNDVLNPEIAANLKKHAVLVNYTPENKTLIGFEDVDRTTHECDHDFNDVVVYATVTP